MSKKLKLKISVAILIILILTVLSIFLHDKITKYKRNNEFSKIVSEFHQNLDTKENLELEIEGNKVIGIITIDKIDLEYPIIEYKDISSLEIGICKYEGVNIGETGNLCLLGHNMRNGIFFTSLYKLENGDIAQITDINGSEIEYEVYDKYYIEPTETKVLEQNNKELKELTLITCNDTSSKRLVIKLKEII